MEKMINRLKALDLSYLIRCGNCDQRAGKRRSSSQVICQADRLAAGMVELFIPDDGRGVGASLPALNFGQDEAEMVVTLSGAVNAARADPDTLTIRYMVDNTALVYLGVARRWCG
jgi:hypothetical protein